MSDTSFIKSHTLGTHLNVTKDVSDMLKMLKVSLKKKTQGRVQMSAIKTAHTHGTFKQKITFQLVWTPRDDGLEKHMVSKGKKLTFQRRLYLVRSVRGAFGLGKHTHPKEDRISVGLYVV